MGHSINEAYEKLEKIGQGTYGKVYKARERTTGRLVALKKTRLEVRSSRIHPRIAESVVNTGRESRRVIFSHSALTATDIFLPPVVAPRWRKRACLPRLSARFPSCRCSARAPSSSGACPTTPIRPRPTRISPHPFTPRGYAFRHATTFTRLFQKCPDLHRQSTLVNSLTDRPDSTRHTHTHRLLKVEHVEEDGKAMLYLVFEYLDQDLKGFMDLTGRGPANPIKKEIVQDFMYQLCLGCAHIHRHGVMHRDLKPQNLLVDKAKNVIKVADLGLGRAFSVPVKSYTHEIVTLWYRAPEVLLGGSHYSTPVDIWSVGCIFAELARKQPLFPGDSELQQLLHIFKLLGTPGEDVWPGVTRLRDWHEFPQWKPQDLHKVIPQLDDHGIDLLQKMLVYDPAKRIHATEALEHPYFDSLDKSRYAKIEAAFEKENRKMANA